MRGLCGSLPCAHTTPVILDEILCKNDTLGRLVLTCAPRTGQLRPPACCMHRPREVRYLAVQVLRHSTLCHLEAELLSLSSDAGSIRFTLLGMVFCQQQEPVRVQLVLQPSAVKPLPGELLQQLRSVQQRVRSDQHMIASTSSSPC